MLAPIVKSALPSPPPTPGDPRGLSWVQEETSRLQGRGDGSGRPENEGDLSPDHGDRRDLAPIVVPGAHDEGGSAAEEVAELEAGEDAKPAAVTWRDRAEADHFRDLGSLRTEYTPEELAMARAAGINDL